MNELIALILLSVVLFSVPLLGRLFAWIRQARKAESTQSLDHAERARGVRNERECGWKPRRASEVDCQKIP